MRFPLGFGRKNAEFYTNYWQAHAVCEKQARLALKGRAGVIRTGACELEDEETHTHRPRPRARHCRARPQHDPTRNRRLVETRRASYTATVKCAGKAWIRKALSVSRPFILTPSKPRSIAKTGGGVIGGWGIRKSSLKTERQGVGGWASRSVA